MTSITSKAKFRQRVIRYSEKYGVTAASIRHRVTRKTIYDWKKKYDGHWKSLRDGSHRPHSHPNQHTAEENALIMRYYARNKEDKKGCYFRLGRYWTDYGKENVASGRKGRGGMRNNALFGRTDEKYRAMP